MSSRLYSKKERQRERRKNLGECGGNAAKRCSPDETPSLATGAVWLSALGSHTPDKSPHPMNDDSHRSSTDNRFRSSSCTPALPPCRLFIASDSIQSLATTNPQAKMRGKRIQPTCNNIHLLLCLCVGLKYRLNFASSRILWWRLNFKVNKLKVPLMGCYLK